MIKSVSKTKKKESFRTMEPKDYIITEISGEYATLTEKISGETLFIALALLPPGSDIGTKLHYEMLEYTIEE